MIIKGSAYRKFIQEGNQRSTVDDRGMTFVNKVPTMI